MDETGNITEGGGPETKPNFQSNSQELVDLLKNPDFQKGFVLVQTQSQREARSAVINALNERVKINATAELLARAAERLGVSVEQGKTRGKEWGETIKMLKDEIVEERTRDDGSTERITYWQQLNERLTADEQNNPEHQQAMAVTEGLIRRAEEIQGQKLQELISEAERRKDDPDLLSALAMWGRCPNAAGDFGTDNSGYHAGVVHFFEYRSSPDKNGRYKYDPIPITIDGFIEYSRKIQRLISDIDPQNNPAVKLFASLQDNDGQLRLFVLSDTGEKVVAFRRVNETGLPKIITIIPGQDEKSMKRSVQDEITGTSRPRLNQLGKGIREISVDQYQELI
jgi:hypothetical protein